MQTLKIDPEFQSLIPALSDDERAELEASLKAEGCRDALVVWAGHDILIDGHHRYAICTTHGVPFDVVEREFEDRDAVREWIIRNQFARRNLTPYTRAVLALRLKDVLAERARRASLANLKNAPEGDRLDVQNSGHRPAGRVDDQLADVAGTSHDTIHKVATVENEAPEPVRQAARAGDISTNRAYEITRALKALPEADRARAAEICIDHDEKARTLVRLHKSQHTDPDSNGTYEEILRTGGFHYGDDMEKWCDYANDDVATIARALKSVAEAHKQLKGDEKLQARVEGVKDIAPAFDDYRHGDCLQHLSSLPPRSVRLLLTDPPYGIDFQSNRRTVSAQAPKLINDETPEKAIALFRAMLSAVTPAMADECHALIFTNWRYEPQFRTALEEAGFEIAASIVWVKENHGSGDLSGFAPRHERILHARRGGAAIRPRLDDVLIVPRERATDHPTEKPTALLEQLIACTTLEGEWVVDPFAGAGSTVVAARRLGRKVFAVELDARWHAAGIERLVMNPTAKAGGLSLALHPHQRVHPRR